MRSSIALRPVHWLSMAGFAVGALAAQAAGAVTITQSDETRIAAGMSENEVRQTLGRPTQINRYPGKPGSTWTYQVQGATFGRTEFKIDFSPDGKVTETGELIWGGASG